MENKQVSEIYRSSDVKPVFFILEIGEEQFLTFWAERLILAKVPINKKIKKNKIFLPGSNRSHKIVKKDQVLTPSMIWRMCSALQFRKDATTDLSGIKAKASMNFPTFKAFADYLHSYIISIYHIHKKRF